MINKLSRDILRGKVQTVLGLIPPEVLGITLPHEHLFADMRDFFIEPNDNEIELAYQPISLENLSWVRYHRMSNLDNLQAFSKDLATEEASLFKKAGGSTIVDVTPINMRNTPEQLVRLSQKTGLNIIMGTAYYRETQIISGDELSKKTAIKEMNSYPARHIESSTKEEIAEEFIREITMGVRDSDIRAGLIGEIGCSFPLTKNEHKVLSAAAIAQRQTGAILMIHPGFNDDSPLEIMRVLSDVGADISRVIMSHMCISVGTHKTRCKLAEMGCYLAWDRFGFDGLYQPPTPIDIPSDQGRVRQIIQLIDEGYLNQILISHDICQKLLLVRFGGCGYAHILNNIIPIMAMKEMTEDQTHAIIVENPKRAFTFV